MAKMVIYRLVRTVDSPVLEAIIAANPGAGLV
jgi:hypothetical protein